jgi:flagella basal body P-ring formation protein FlgA
MIRTLLFRMIAAMALATLAVGFIAMRPVSAAELKRSVVVSTDLVLLGDLFDGAGPLASKPVFRSPELGVSGALPVADALAAASAAGLALDTPPDFTSISVVRRSVDVTADTMRALVAKAAATRLGVASDDVMVTFETDPTTVAADAAAREPVSVDTLNMQTGSGRFDAAIAIDVGSRSRTIMVRGRAAETVAVPVLRRAFARQDIIRADDVVMSRVERRFLAPGAALDASDLIGKAVKRPIRAGDVIAAADVEPPRMVVRGDSVTLMFNKPGLTLSARGKAMSDGAEGSVVSVLNEQSRRVIQGVVTGPGLVAVGSATAAPTVVATIKN